ncbi:MAG: hypothetical protein Q8M16_23710 [Pirellulaceae bacterium]|nr:hypothetical protein [Pirellulaceae bacterium]
MPQQSFRFLDPDSPRRAPNYGSRKVQIKLMMLVGSLFAVVWCMQYAGRPETWRWLFAMDEAQQNDLPSGDDSAPETDQPQPLPAVTEPHDFNPIWPNPMAAAETLPRLPLSLEAVYWKTALDRLTPEQKFAFVDAVHQWSTDLVPNVAAEPILRSALTKLTNLRQRLDQQLNAIALRDGPEMGSGNADPLDVDGSNSDLGTDAIAETEIAEEGPEEGLPSLNPSAMTRPLFDLPTAISIADAQAITDHSRWLAIFWNPRIQSGDYAESPEAPTPTIQSLRLSEAVANRNHWKLLGEKFLDPHLLSTIADGSRLGRPEERAAWLRFVQNARPRSSNEPRPEKAELITRQNLLGQPNAFRGHRVRLTGTIRRVELVRQSDPVVAKSMAADEYAVVWLQPAVSGQGPYCIYCTSDATLKQMAESTPDPRRMASVEALFFKLYPYTTNSGKTAVCPLLVTDTVELTELRPDTPQTTLDSSQWIMVIAGISLLAVGLATAGWYSTRYRSANPLGARKRESAQVDWLDRTQVPSTGESLRELASQQQLQEKSHEQS